MDIGTIRKDLEEARRQVEYWTERATRLSRFWADLVALYPETAGLARLEEEAAPSPGASVVTDVLRSLHDKELRGQAAAIRLLEERGTWMSPAEVYEALIEEGSPRSAHSDDPTSAVRKALARASKAGQVIVRQRDQRTNEYHVVQRVDEPPTFAGASQDLGGDAA